MGKALFFLNSFVGGGAERVCLNLAKQLHKLNIESDFVTIYNREPDYDMPDYIHVFPLDIENKPGERFYVIKAVPKVNAFISDKKYVLITAHVQPSQLLASLTKVRKRCLYVIHASQYCTNERNARWYNRVILKLFLRGKKIITVSQGIKDELKNDFGICPENIKVIYNPCGIAALKAQPQLPSPHSRPYILVMGRLVKTKNPFLALELFYKGKFYEYYDLIYLGKGPLKDILRERIVDHGMENYVFLAGFQKNPAQWLINASLLLSCSNNEGLPMNLIEALVCGTPVVAADCPCGPNEILTGELAKYLIYPEQDPDKSVSIIASALKEYPPITEEYYGKFADGLIAGTYLNVWKENFGRH